MLDASYGKGVFEVLNFGSCGRVMTLGHFWRCGGEIIARGAEHAFIALPRSASVRRPSMTNTII
jgi:hypothetical protein